MFSVHQPIFHIKHLSRGVILYLENALNLPIGSQGFLSTLFQLDLQKTPIIDESTCRTNFLKILKSVL